MRPGDAAVEVRLYCFPHAGGSATYFRDWARRLRPSIDVVAIDPPGRGSRFNTPVLTRLTDVVADVQVRIDSSDDVPVALFGHSMGAAVAYEVARCLQEHGRPPVHVVVSGHEAPDADHDRDPLHLLEDAELLNHLARLDGIPRAVLADRELLELMLPIVRADLTAIETYRHDPDPLATFPITALGGAGDRLVGRDGLARWGRLTSGEFRWALLPAGHFYPDDVLPTLFTHIRRALAGASTGWGAA
jgi:surfactin synthase thioesterase subunit